MRSFSGVSLKSRFTQILWVGNAVVCGFLALHGAVMYFGVFGYESQLSALTMRAGAVLATAGVVLTVFSLLKARSTATAR
jgi:hypothetical protein